MPFSTCSTTLPDGFKQHFSDVCESWPEDGKLPVIYHERYNITWMGLQNLSSLDACKPRSALRSLQDKGTLTGNGDIVEPLEVTDEALLRVHDAEYLTKLKTWNLRIAQVTETPSLMLLPNSLLQRVIISPLRYQTAGTILAAGLAVQRGWAINLGGGFHHSCWNQGRAWCAFADITLAIQRVRQATSCGVLKVLLLDLDAHQGNGVQRDKLNTHDSELTIVDLHTANIFPRDDEAAAAIDVRVELPHGTGDEGYLAQLDAALHTASSVCPQPDLVMYIAGVDVLAGDRSGRQAVSAAGVVARDERVFRYALEQKAPICMLMGGGNTYEAAGVVAESISNLFTKLQLGNTRGSTVELSPLMAANAADSVAPCRV